VPLRIVRGLVKLLRLEDVVKRVEEGIQQQRNNDLRKVSKTLPTIRPVISFLFCSIDTDMFPQDCCASI
jgi:hypothetical protein